MSTEKLVNNTRKSKHGRLIFVQCICYVPVLRMQIPIMSWYKNKCVIRKETGYSDSENVYLVYSKGRLFEILFKIKIWILYRANKQLRYESKT